ncbi:MAG: tRNA lysidine(34) synthetase TilS [Rhodobacteraceae bacterium]|nr:tRNA lysidine(34) synthetase TilS [Paracoccaceae bacterium]
MSTASRRATEESDVIEPLSSESFEAALAVVFPELNAATKERPAKLALAVSGGSDSRALLELSATLAKRRPLKLWVLTVDHGLRSESVAEAEAVAARCAELGVAHHILAWRGPKPAGNIAAAARDARYQLMRSWRRDHKVAALAVAHTRDDVAETFLMRLSRGSGVDGLAEMAAVVDEGAGFRRIRPLLAVPRSTLRATCKTYSAKWIEDPSNDDLRFDRARARRALAALAPLGLTVDRLAKTARSMRRARDALETETTRVRGKVVKFCSELGWAALSAQALSKLEREIALRLLSDTLRRVSSVAYPPRLDALEAVLEALIAGETSRTLHGCVVERRAKSDVVAVSREPSACQHRTPLDPNVETIWDGRFVVTVDRPGCEVGAIGAEGVAEMRRELERAARDEAKSPPSPEPTTWRRAPSSARRAACGVFYGDQLLAAPAAGRRRAGVSMRLISALDGS